MAAIIRHSPATEIKKRFVNFYNSGEYKNRSDAARKFARTLTVEEWKDICPSKDTDNLIITLRKALKELANQSH